MVEAIADAQARARAAHARPAPTRQRERRGQLVGDLPRDAHGRRAIAPGVSDPLQGGDLAAWRAPSGSSSRSTSTARSRRSWTGRRTRAPPIARARRSSGSPTPTTPASRSSRAGRSRASEVAAPPDAALLSGSHGVELQLDPARRHDRPARRGAGRARAAHRPSSRRRRRVPTASGSSASPRPRPPHAQARARPPARRCSARPAAGRAELPGISVRSGKSVLEFAVRSSDKGRRWPACASTWAPTASIYVGDDVTDEDAFAALDERRRRREGRPGQVDRDATACAAPEDVAELLERLADASARRARALLHWT